ncbi:hypothetical protein N0V93_008696 [Gnomoniopsis smithogilvyi]|uniref:Cytochrome P450 n=1 Tax=Gnomoniopsis smithogilvyi TaxID=1191159 RepID=A0A9W8YN88_9PEZI|nr:hypothetical protein N0V93_008696 [Gnomoniopsis smithogilvyi]
MSFQNIVTAEYVRAEFILGYALGAICVYAALRCLYLLYVHPLAKFPGPRLAAVSNVWYARHWLSGRWPWAIEDVLHKYGDVVRIAPNELVFFTPQALHDIYSPARRGLEIFRKTDFQNRGANLGGIIWEEDPVKHHEVARKLFPAFGLRSIRGFEPLMHKHIDYFIERMKQLGTQREGVNLVDWTHWVAWDTSQDIAWCEETHCMRDGKDPVALDVLMSFNAFATMIQVFKRFPLLSPVKYLFAPVKKLSSLAEMESNTRKSVLRRIERRGNTPHQDLFEYVLSVDDKPPTTNAELLQLGSVALQVMLAGFGPVADWYYFTLFLLINTPKCYRILTDEIRNEFANYDDINPQSTARLQYLVACLEETLRMVSTNSTGLPRYSPGAVVDGHYIPKGVTVQSSVHTLGRSPKYFHDPMRFRPERYLPSSHPLYDKAFANDSIKGLPAFSLGPRACIGRELGWAEARLFMSKVLWQFDVVRASGEALDMEGMERDLLHFGFLTKPRFMVQFVPLKRETSS